MRRVVVLLALVSMASGAEAQRRQAVRDSGATAPTGGPGAFAGTYSVSGSFTINISSMNPPLNQTMEEQETVSVSSSSTADMVMTFTGDSGGNCILTATRTGEGSATFTPGQQCHQVQPGAELTLTLRSGSATLAGSMLNLDFSWSVSVVVNGLTGVGSASEHEFGPRR